MPPRARSPLSNCFTLCCAQSKRQAELEEQLQKSSVAIEELSRQVEERGRALDSLQVLPNPKP